MNIVISGYGRMGKLVRDTALERGHRVTAILNTTKDWNIESHFEDADVVIDFSEPATAVENILRCFAKKIPVVTGTTGWYSRLDEVKKACTETEGALFYAPNFSIGVHVYFEVNRKLATLMQGTPNYGVRIEETHHTGKLDAPSGTAIKLAEDILSINTSKKAWVNSKADSTDALEIISLREDNITGTHKVIYTSFEDELLIEHKAFNRKGFATGAVMAAEWLLGKKGVFGMKDLLPF